MKFPTDPETSAYNFGRKICILHQHLYIFSLIFIFFKQKENKIPEGKVHSEMKRRQKFEPSDVNKKPRAASDEKKRPATTTTTTNNSHIPKVFLFDFPTTNILIFFTRP